jgi:glyoxylate reductase
LTVLNYNQPMKVLVTRRIHSDAIDLLLSAGYKVKYHDVNNSMDRSSLEKELPAYDAVLTCITDVIDREILKAASGKLKIISNMAAGLDNIDVDKARESGIEVYNTPGAATDSTADLTITLAFALIRKIKTAGEFISGGNWKGWDPEIFVGRSFSKLSWGIIGFGNIGKALARKLSGFGMPVWFYDPGVNDPPPCAVKKDLSFLLANADIISLHLPLNEETTHFFDRDKFGQMKPSSYLINMARGKVVNSSDLMDALHTGRIAGAALDVFDPEPVPEDHEILSFDNVIITPHIGTATLECRREMAVMAAFNIINNLKHP